VAVRTDLPPAVTALIDVGLGLARRAPSARLAIARAGGILEPEAMTPELAALVEREVTAAREAVCVPLDRKTVEGVLKNAWGQAPAKALDDFDPDPLAVTPAAQVHRGELDGTQVAIKVRRPGVERSVRNDLTLLDVLAAPLRSAFPRLDAVAVLRDAREQALDELDFEHEASTQRRVARALRDVDGVTVPRPHLDLCTGEVLVADFAPGTTLAGGARPDDAGAAAHALVAAVRASVLDAGLAPVDLRSSHVVVGRRGELALLGTGVSRPVDRTRAQDALRALQALASDDTDAFASTVAANGILEEATAREAIPILRDVLGGLLDGPATLDAAAIRDLGERARDHAPALARTAMAAAPHPEDLALGRTLGQLVAVLSRLEAHDDWVTLAA
jgi:hypothetical protein